LHRLEPISMASKLIMGFDSCLPHREDVSCKLAGTFDASRAMGPAFFLKFLNDRHDSKELVRHD